MGEEPSCSQALQQLYQKLCEHRLCPGAALGQLGAAVCKAVVVLEE